MIGFYEAVSMMHTRGITIDEKDYIFTLLVVVGEDPQSAYAFAYDMEGMKRAMGTEEEEDYLASKKKDAETMFEQQNIVHLRDAMTDVYRAQIQAAALNLKDFRFSGQETVQILNNLLKTRIDDLESSSVKDVVALLKALTDQGALEIGDGGWSKHFVVIPRKYDALCTNCNHELYAVEGVNIKCPSCGQVYQWEGNRFYPQMSKL